MACHPFFIIKESVLDIKYLLILMAMSSIAACSKNENSSSSQKLLPESKVTMNNDKKPEELDCEHIIVSSEPQVSVSEGKESIALKDADKNIENNGEIKEVPNRFPTPEEIQRCRKKKPN